MFQSDKPDSKTSSILGPELEIHGDVKVSGSLLIYGKVFGNIQSSGSVRTANGSVVNGNISANDVTIGGKVEGDLDVEKKVILGDTSYLTGNLKASKPETAKHKNLKPESPGSYNPELSEPNKP